MRVARKRACHRAEPHAGVAQSGATDGWPDGYLGGEGSRRETAKGFPSGARRAEAKESTLGVGATESKNTEGE